jgi:hypothetical protein
MWREAIAFLDHSDGSDQQTVSISLGYRFDISIDIKPISEIYQTNIKVISLILKFCFREIKNNFRILFDISLIAWEYRDDIALISL